MNFSAPPPSLLHEAAQATNALARHRERDINWGLNWENQHNLRGNNHLFFSLEDKRRFGQTDTGLTG